METIGIIGFIQGLFPTATGLNTYAFDTLFCATKLADLQTLSDPKGP